MGHSHPHEGPRHHSVEIADPECRHRRDERILGALGLGPLDCAPLVEYVL